MKIVIASGFFNPLHGGHLDMLEAAAKLGDKLIVLVDNDKQQMIKKGKIILSEQERLRVIKSLRIVDEAMISLGDEPGQIETFKYLIDTYPNDELIFVNDGDRDSDKAILEADFCRDHNIQMLFNVSDKGKVDSSTRINKALGREE